MIEKILKIAVITALSGASVALYTLVYYLFKNACE